MGGTKFFDRAEVKDVLSYLCVLNNPLDDLRLRRILNVPARGIGNTTIEKLTVVAAEQQLSLYETIRNADLFPELKSAAAKLLKFADLIDSLRAAGGRLALPEFYDQVLDDTGYVRALEEKNDMESRGRIENVQELKSNILGFLDGEPEDPTLSGFLNEIALYTDLDSVSADDDCVTMMTMHAAKGLEFPVVYVVGVEEGLFPGQSAAYDPEELEEERRICYVAMTRAKEKLTLTNARQRMLYGKTSPCQPSRFLKEIPEANMEWQGKPEPRPERSEWDADGFGSPSWDDGFDGSFRQKGSYGGYRASSGGYGGGSYGGRSGGYGGGASWQRSSAPGGGSSSAGRSYSATASGRTARPSPARSASPAGKPAPKAAATVQFQAGDRVEHSAFGQGTVLSVTPMGGDALMEVQFGDIRKKLMWKTAGAHMKKV